MSTQSQKIEAASYLRGLAERLLEYPTDHYKEAAEALLAEAAEEESAADAAPPPSPEALIQRLRRLADNWSAADGYAPSCIEEAADALASSQEALSAYREALEDFRRENMTLRNAAVTAVLAALVVSLMQQHRSVSFSEMPWGIIEEWGLLFDNGIVPQKPPTKVEGS